MRQQAGLSGAVADCAEDVDGTVPAVITRPIAASARIRNGMWSKSTEPCAGQQLGRCGAKTTGVKLGVAAVPAVVLIVAAALSAGPAWTPCVRYRVALVSCGIEALTTGVGLRSAGS